LIIAKDNNSCAFCTIVVIANTVSNRKKVADLDNTTDDRDNNNEIYQIPDQD